MKKRILTVLLAVLLAAVCLPVSARAAAQVDVQITAAPDSLLAAGNVSLNVSIRVTALTTAEISNVALYMTGGSVPLATWQSVTANHPVAEVIPDIYISEQQIGSTVPMELRYFDGGVEKTVYTAVSVFRGVPQIVHETNVRFTREASHETASAGTPVTLTYWIGNTGSTPLYDISVQDPIAGTVGTRNYLSPGESVAFYSTLTMRETTASTPVLTYRAQQGGDLTTVTLDPLTIVLADAKLTVTLEADVKEIRAGEAVTLTYNIVNEGNVPFYNLQISDDTGMIAGRDELAAGGSYAYVRKENLVKPGEFYFEVSAADSTGTVMQVKSNVVSVNVIDVVLESVQPIQEILSINVVPSVSKVTESSDITFDITVSNRGTEPVYGVVLSELSTGVEFGKMDQFVHGDKNFKYTATVSQETTFTFMVQGRLASETRVQTQSNPVTIAFEAQTEAATPFPWELSPSPSLAANSQETPAPSASAAPTSPPSLGSRSSLLLAALLVVAALIIICVIALVVSARRNRSRAEYDDYYEEEPYYDDPPQEEEPYETYEYDPTEPSDYDDEDEVTQPVNRKPPSTDDVPTRPVDRE